MAACLPDLASMVPDDKHEDHAVLRDVGCFLIMAGVRLEAARQYAVALVAEGFDTAALLGCLTPVELVDDFGFKKGHVRALEIFCAARGGYIEPTTPSLASAPPYTPPMSQPTSPRSDPGVSDSDRRFSFADVVHTPHQPSRVAKWLGIHCLEAGEDVHVDEEWNEGVFVWADNETGLFEGRHGESNSVDPWLDQLNGAPANWPPSELRLASVCTHSSVHSETEREPDREPEDDGFLSSSTSEDEDAGQQWKLEPA